VRSREGRKGRWETRKTNLYRLHVLDVDHVRTLRCTPFLLVSCCLGGGVEAQNKSNA
jgi:hypothetical protein